MLQRLLLSKYGKINPRFCNQLPIQKNSFLNFALFLKLYMGLFLFSLLKFGMRYTKLYYIVYMLHKWYFIFNILYKIDKQYSIQVLFIYIYVYIHMQTLPSSFTLYSISTIILACYF